MNWMFAQNQNLSLLKQKQEESSFSRLDVENCGFLCCGYA